MQAQPTPKKKMESSQNIQVFLRVRPLNSSEKSQRSCSVVDVPSGKEVVVKEKPNSSTTKTFKFDRAFGPLSKQVDVYKSVVTPLIKQVLEGYNCTVFAYGQTGTGKTYTMEGLGEIRGSWENDPDAGIIPRSLSDLFDGLRMSNDTTEYSVRVSFLEMYNEEIYDLLSAGDDLGNKLRLYEDGSKKGSVIIQGLEELQVHDKREVYNLLERGSIKRKTAETKMNANSSRSHTVFTVTVFINQQSIDGDDMLKIGKLNLVDLAGSENIGRSGAVDKRAREAGNINQSLLTLGRVITSLVDRKPHIPYRESKLTRLLQDSLGGRTKTSIIATISPASINLEETLSTLDYAHRAKNIQNKPEVNQKISKKEKLKEYHQEIDKLKSELQAARDKDGVFLPKATYDEQTKAFERQQEEIKNFTIQLKQKEEELEKFMELFKETKVKLEETTEERDKNQRALDCTRTVLHKTESEKQEQIHLVKKHIETECKLNQQAQLLLEVSDEASKDLKRVHDKVERQRLIASANMATTEDFQHDYVQRQSQMDGLVGSHIDSQTKFCDTLRATAAERIEKSNEEKNQISSTYTETVSKLVETMSQLERVSSDNMYKEQAWVEKLLKRMRNEADTQTQSFHTYLVEQLLSVASSILAATKNQQKTVDSLSSKIDQSVEGLNARLDKFMSAQNSLQNEMLQQGEITFKGIVQNTAGLSSLLTAEQEASQDYKKKSAAFTEQMIALLRAREVEEEKYLVSRNETLTNSIKIADSTSELAETGRTDGIKFNTKTVKLNNDYKKEESIEVEKLKEEKSKAVEQIETDLAIVAQASERLKSNAESFVNAGKDAWNNHYEKTEVELREKSDSSSNHVQDLQSHTSDARSAILSSQSKLDSILEGHRRSDERNAITEQARLASRCQETKDFETAYSDQSQSLGHALRTYVKDDLKQDVPTGHTPMRVDRQYPKKLIQGTPDDIRLKNFRSVRDVSRVPFENIENMAGEIDMDSVISTSTNLSRQSEASSPGASDSISNSKVSSAQLSRQNSEIGYGSGTDAKDKENDAPANDNFTRPKSKLKQPAIRSSSRNRQQV